MKLEVFDDKKMVLYLSNYFFNSTEKEIVTKEIKNIFIRLIKYYHIKINGFYEVFVLENKKYGTILEIKKRDELLFNPDLIDIKVRILKNINIYLKTDNYFILEKYQNVYYFNNNYYIKIDDVDHIIDIIEFVSIEYMEDDNYLKKMLFIQ